jgi:signal transduction histidine kinase
MKKEDLLSLQRAFETFQRQSEMLERSHGDLKLRLEEAQSDLAGKNRQLARTVEALAATKARLSGILESISDAVITVGKDGVLRPANEAACDFIATCGLAANPTLHGSPAFREALARTHDGMLEMPTPSGKRRYLLSAILMKTGGSEGELVVSLKDVTELLELQERVGREDRMAALGRVAASVAHEIRNPLGAIEGFGMLLERDLKDSPSLLRLASKTVYAARQLNSVVSNLLSYTRELRVDMRPCDLEALLESSLDFVKPIALDRKTQLEVVKSPVPLPPALADQRQLGQVLINVMLNAVEACPHRGGGRVAASCHLSEDRRFLSIVVSDTGPGVPSGLKKRIFEPFFTTKDGGTGLGLSLCQRIVEAHGGSISESGDEGAGARFVIELKASGASK